MKRPVKRISTNLYKWLAGGLLAFLALLLPVTSMAADEVHIESTMGVANVTAGDTDYVPSVNAKTNEVVKVQVYYRNTEDAASNKTAQQVRMKLDVPTAAGKAQTIKASVKGDNTNAVSEQVTVNVDSDTANLQYIPGTATWKHNTGTNDAANFIEEKVSDDIVSGAQGIVLEDTKPGNFSATVTILARVMAPGVKVTNQVQLKGETGKWAGSNTAKPGDTVRYLIGYQNMGNTNQANVMVRDTLPAHMSIVPGTTTLTNSAIPDGQAVGNDNVVTDGVNIGNYGAGANAYVTFEAKIDDADKLACGTNDLRNSAGVTPSGMSQYTASAVTTVTRDCSTKPTSPTTPTTPTTPAPVYTCDNLTLTKGDNRTITAKVNYTAKNGASLKTVTYNFGDGGQPLTTDKTSVNHTYAKDGTYSVTATLLLSVNGKDQTTTSEACAQSVTFAPASTTPSSPSTTPTAGKGDLPNTGPGDVAALFVGASVAGAIFHRLFLSRRLARR